MYTGERILPQDIFNVTHQQSLLAYELAGRLASQKTVLDVACGEGYGLKYLAGQAREVVGVDYDAGTIAHIRSTYPDSNISALPGDLFKLPEVVGNRLFDVVCLFQTIEHVTEQDKVLEILKQVTRPGGTIVVSTPNRAVFPTFNPYHVRELNYEELRDLFRRHFTSFTIHGVFGDDVVMKYRRSKQGIGKVILRLDVLGVRHRLPVSVVQQLYSFISFRVIKRLSFWQHRKEVVAVGPKNFSVKTNDVEHALDFIAVATVGKSTHTGDH